MSKIGKSLRKQADKAERAWTMYLTCHRPLSLADITRMR